MKNKVFYIVGPSIKGDALSAGAKFPLDLIEIATKHGGVFIPIHEYYSKKTFIIYGVLEVFNLLIKISNKSSVFYIDIVDKRISRKIVYSILKFKKCKIFPIIEDLNFLREDRNESIVKNEINRLKFSAKIISQNQVMSEFLRSYDVSNDFVELDVLDYLYESYCSENIKALDKNIVCYGGSLSKSQSGFIHAIKKSHNITYYVYGNNLFKEPTQFNVIYKGGFNADQCISELEGGWGLVWNGSSSKINNNDKRSTYYNYVCPHKFSMYALCGFPVIVYKNAALSKFVNDYRCGITIDSLDEIEDRIMSVSKEEYDDLCNNIRVIGEKVSTGYYFTKALLSCLG